MTRAAYYLRVSTRDQVDGTSLDTQRAWCVTQIVGRGWDNAGEYIDAGVSGSDASRPGWQALLRDADAGKFEAVFVFDIDRFTRDALHGLEALRDLRNLGVKLHDAKNPDADAAGDGNQLLTSIRLVIAEEERRKIQERTVRGQRAKLASGRWPGGKPPYGWKLEGHKKDVRPVPNEDERRALRLMFDWTVRERLTTSNVRDRLHAMGVPTRQGKQWLRVVVRDILRQPALYTGEYVWGSASSREVKRGRDGKPLYGEAGRVLMPEPPFSREEFNALQRALDVQARRMGPKPDYYSRVLTGRVVGECGKQYTGVTQSGTRPDVYRCHGRTHRGSGVERCSCPQVRAVDLEERVWGEVASLLGDPDRLEDLARQWLALSESETPDAEERTALEAQAAKLARALERAEDDYYLADDQAKHKERVERFRGDLAQVQLRLDAVERTEGRARATAGQLQTVASLARRAAHRLESMGDAEKRQVVDLLNVRVTIGDVQKSVPQLVQVTGRLDSRLFGGGGVETLQQGNACAPHLPHPANNHFVRPLPGRLRAPHELLTHIRKERPCSYCTPSEPERSPNAGMSPVGY